jgi:hypothetical protein
MLTFYGYVGSKIPQVSEFEKIINKSLTNNDGFKYGSYKDKDVFLTFSDFKESSLLPAIDRTKQVIILAAGHLFEWADGRPNSSDKNFEQEILKEYLLYGLNGLKGCKGKYSIVIIDKRYCNCRVYLVTDRCGFFPFYYHSDIDGISFATQAESIGVSGIYKPRLNVDAITQVLSMGVVYNRKSFYDDIQGIPSGNLITYQNGECLATQFMEPMPWPEKPLNNYLDCVDSFAEAIKNSTRRIGTYCKGSLILKLSGGCDSRVLLGCLLSQKQDFQAVTNYEFDQEIDQDCLSAKKLQKLFGFPFMVTQSTVSANEEIGDMMLKRFGVIKGTHKEYKLTGSGSADFLERWIKPFEQAGIIASERAFGLQTSFTKKCLDSLSFDIKEVSRKILENRINNYYGSESYKHNMDVVFCTFLKTDDTAKSRPQQLFLGNCLYPNFDEDVMIAVANYPLLLPGRKVKFFTEVLKRHFHPDLSKVELTHLLDKSTPEPGRKGTFKNSDFYSGRELLRLYPDTKKKYEEKARKILSEPNNYLLGNVLSEQCLKAPFFPIHFSLAIIYWNSWKQLYLPDL